MKKHLFFLISAFIINSLVAQDPIKSKTEIFGSAKQYNMEFKNSKDEYFTYSKCCDTAYEMMEPKIQYNYDDYKGELSHSDEFIDGKLVDSDKNSHILTLRFDLPVGLLGAVFLTNEEMYMTKFDFNWINDYKAKTYLEEGEYSILIVYFSYASFTYEDSCLYIVSIPNLLLDHEMDTLINIEELVSNYVYLDFRDEFGNIITSNDTNIIESQMDCNIHYPDGLKLQESGFGISNYPVDYYRASDIDSNYTISNHLSDFRHKKLYTATFDPLKGISGDTLISNDIDKYIKSDVILSNHPNSNNNYLSIANGTMMCFEDSYAYLVSLFKNLSYPIENNDTIQMFISNHYIEGSVFFLGSQFITYEYIDSLNLFNDLIFEMPIYRLPEPDESIVIGYAYPPFNADYFLGDQSIYHIDYEVPFAYFFSYNQSDQIYGNFNWELFSNQANGLRAYDYQHAHYTITKGDSVLDSGLTNHFAGPYTVDSSGVYQLTITNDQFFLNDSSANLIMKNTFDLSQEDCNPPSLCSFKILDSQKRITSTIKQYENASIFFSVTDGYDSETNADIKPDRVLAYYKLNHTKTWIPIDVIVNDDLYDYYPGYGYYYTINIDEVYDSIEMEDVLVDLRLVLLDETGNESEHSWYSAFKVISTISIDELDIVFQNLSLSPNPTKDGCYISFDLPADSDVSISIWNVAGILVKELTGVKYTSGNHKVYWNGTDFLGKKVPSGIYFVNMISTQGQETIQLIIQ